MLPEYATLTDPDVKKFIFDVTTFSEITDKKFIFDVITFSERTDNVFIVITLVEGLNVNEVAAYLLLVTPPTTADGTTAKLKLPISETTGRT